MNEIYAVLNSTYVINKICINQPFQLDIETSIDIEIKKQGEMVHLLKFSNVDGVKIGYGYFDMAREAKIIIDDMSDRQLENVRYLVTICEESMEFYCKDIELTSALVLPEKK